MAQISPIIAERPFILTIDIGTSSIRVMLFDRYGRQLAPSSSQEPNNIQIKHDGTAEGDPNAILLSVFRCIDKTLQEAASFNIEIDGVGITTIVGNILGIDESNNAITPLITYADTRAADEAFKLRQELNERTFHQRTGCYFHPSYLPAQFRWMSKTKPNWIKNTTSWISIADYLLFTLFEEAATSYSIAAWTGMLDRTNMTWDEELISLLPIEHEQMLSICDCTKGFSSLSSDFANRWPQLAEIPWFVAIGDGASANIGCGSISPSKIALTLGTTGAMRIITDSPVTQIPAGLWNYPIDKKRSLTGGAMTEGGNVYSWLKNSFKYPKNIDDERLLEDMPPDGHNLTILPLFSGERSPGWVGNARATIHGLSLQTSPIEIYQAMLEAISLRFSLIYELLVPLSDVNVQIIANGGALLNNPHWLQIISDVLNRPVVISEVPEVSSRGTALLVLETLEKSLSIAKMSHFYGKRYQPDPKHHSIYMQAQSRQKKLYDLIVKQDSV